MGKRGWIDNIVELHLCSQLVSDRGDRISSLQTYSKHLIPNDMDFLCGSVQSGMSVNIVGNMYVRGRVMRPSSQSVTSEREGMYCEEFMKCIKHAVYAIGGRLGRLELEHPEGNWFGGIERWRVSEGGNNEARRDLWCSGRYNLIEHILTPSMNRGVS